MAGDWIKMRSDLQSHPKVVRILSATLRTDSGHLSDRLRVVGGLHAVWSVFDTHSTNGVLPGYTPDLMDQVIGWPGFSVAMIDVGWLEFDGDGSLQMPEFSEHNGKSAKRRAEDQKRKRNERDPSAECPQNVRKIADKKRTRDRDREDIEDTVTNVTVKRGRAKPQNKTRLPDGFGISLAVQRWAAEHKHDRLPDHLEHFVGYVKANGKTYADWDQALMNAIRNNWAKLGGTNGIGKRPDRETPLDRTIRDVRTHFAEMDNRDGAPGGPAVGSHGADVHGEVDIGSGSVSRHERGARRDGENVVLETRGPVRDAVR